jgi:hypothetical protein
MDTVSTWQSKIRNLRKKVKGWNINRDSEIKKCKQDLILELDSLDTLVETQSLTAEESARRKELSIKLDKFWKIEETKAWQRSRDREIKEEDRNTAYFFAKANQRRRRRKVITYLEENDASYTDTKSMLNHAVQFYKILFAKEQRENIKLDEDFWETWRKLP